MSEEQVKNSAILPKTEKRDADHLKTGPEQDKSKCNDSPALAADEAEGDTAALDSRVQAHIGRLLRARYRVLLDEPMPDRLRLCLEALAKKEEGS